jgi:hypothetical protein
MCELVQQDKPAKKTSKKVAAVEAQEFRKNITNSKDVAGKEKLIDVAKQILRSLGNTTDLTSISVADTVSDARMVVIFLNFN